MKKEMERDDQLSPVLYSLVAQEILIKLHLGPNREAYSTQKGKTWDFVNKSAWVESVNPIWVYFNFHINFWWQSYFSAEEIQIRYIPSTQKLSSSTYRSHGLSEHPKCSCSTTLTMSEEIKTMFIWKYQISETHSSPTGWQAPYHLMWKGGCDDRLQPGVWDYRELSTVLSKASTSCKAPLLQPNPTREDWSEGAHVGEELLHFCRWEECKRGRGQLAKSRLDCDMFEQQH